MGRCFEAALEVRRQLGIDVDAYICHGKPIGTGPHNNGLRYWHAWVEVQTEDGGWMVFDGTRWLDTKGEEAIFVLPRQRYYFVGQIVHDDVMRFNFVQAVTAMMEYEHYGPWCEFSKEEL